MSGREHEYLRLSAGARGFGLLALVVPVLWSQQPVALLGLAALGVVWSLAQLAQVRRSTGTGMLVVGEAVAVGLVCGLVLSSSVSILGAIAVTAFTAGLRLGWRGVVLTVLTEASLLFLGPIATFDPLSAEEVFGALTWTITSLGIGLVAGSVHASLQDSSDPLAPYRYAQTLFRELIDLSGGLSSGLDPVALGSTILSTVGDELPTAALVLYVPRGDTLTPLLTDPPADAVDIHVPGADFEGATSSAELAVAAWALNRPVLAERAFAFPLVTEAASSVVVAGRLSDRVDPGQIGLRERVEALGSRLAPNAVHLDTALLFASFRDAATADERRRLAREMHDGVAQDIASLGYLVDVLAASPSGPEQARRIAVLRERITAVVGEVRRSVLTLRTESGSSESLGAAIGTVARNLTEVSGVPIHVTLDERTSRLRPEVEAELFRITQEAMTNAVRHAQASSIDVHCLVDAPDARITVTDDGRGLQQPRSDSHGLEIMRERALLIGASLTIHPGSHGGTRVCVQTSAALSEPPVGTTVSDGIVSA